MLRTLAVIVWLVAAFAALAAEQGSPADRAGVEFFEKRIRPLLAEHCYQCHGPKKQRSGLALNSRPGILQGGDRGPAIVPGEPEASLLIQAVRYTDDDLQHAAQGQAQGGADRRPGRLGQDGRPGAARRRRNQAVQPTVELRPGRAAQALGLSAGAGHVACRAVKDAGMVRARRSITSSWPGWKRPGLSPVAAGREANAHSPR